MINRRDFLRRLITGTAALAIGAHELDLDRLLWVPGQMVAVPANTFVSADWVTREMLREFRNRLAFVNIVNRQYDQQFKDDLQFVAGDQWPTVTIRDRRRVA